MKITFTSIVTQVISGRWTKRFSFCLAIMALIIFNAQAVSAQDDDDDEEPIVVQVYDVAEFVTQKSDQPFKGFVIPGLAPDPPKQNWGYGCVGSCPPAGGGSSGGGAFSIAPSNSPQFGGGFIGVQSSSVGCCGTQQLTTDDLANVIMESVAQDSWMKTNGQLGGINFIGTTMIVSQTPTIHKQIETLLDALSQTKASSKNQSSITINAIWLTIDETQFATLAPKSDQSVNKDALKNLTEEFGRRAQITCFEGQSVHVAAGNLRSTLDSLIPIVGQNELPGERVKAIAKTEPVAKPPKHVMAQVLGEGNGFIGRQGKAGYQPVSRWTNYGTVLQVLPRIEADQQISLDVSSIVVRPSGEKLKVEIDQIEIDKINMYCQQFKTSIRIDDSTPTLVGGSAFDAAPQGKLQTYLILEAAKVVKPAAIEK